MVPITPINRLIAIRTIYAVLGTSKKKENGYINGVIDQLVVRKVTIKYIINIKGKKD